MLNRLRSLLPGLAAPSDVAQGDAKFSLARAFLEAPLVETPRVAPPEMANDDAMAVVFDEVERELKRGGYLR